MTEADLLRRIRELSTARNAAVKRGIGDDCAVVEPPDGSELVFTTDFSLEGRHFTLELTAQKTGARVLSRSLSDLAAMGAEPLFCLVSLALPPELTNRWMPDFFCGMNKVAAEFGLEVAGGDLSRNEQIIVDVMCCGHVPRGRALLRSGAKVGDSIYVTGRLGKQYTTPIEPRIREGVALRGVATACIDISDGLLMDLHRLCLSSGVSAWIASRSVPRQPYANFLDALTRGENYELLFTAPEKPDIACTRIGMIEAETPGTLRVDGMRVEPEGWDPFLALF